MRTALQAHLAVCEQTYQIILEENQILKETGKPPEEPVLARKRCLLVNLEASLEALRQSARSTTPNTCSTHPLIEKAQQVIMKTLLIDRENEQLLLKNAITRSTQPAIAKPSIGRLQQIYARYR